MTKEIRLSLLAWLAMLLLLLATWGLSHVLTGGPAILSNLSIAFGKAALIYWFFMQGRRETGLVRLSGLLGGVWLLILFLLSFSDYLTRSYV